LRIDKEDENEEVPVQGQKGKPLLLPKKSLCLLSDINEALGKPGPK
jgi:hypothetical protein